VAGRYRLLRGTHSGPDGRTIHHGETFEPTAADPPDGQSLRGRVVRAASVFVMPSGYDRIDWSDEDSGG